MSADTEQDRVPESEAVLEQFQRWYHVPALLGVVAYMLWIRTRAYDAFVTDDGVFFRGNDAYYHYRATMYSAENWLQRLYFDPWTYFPYGSTSGQFGTLFDQFFAAIALVIGLGDPSARQVAIVAVLAPAVLGALVAVPTYFLATRLSGSRLGGVSAAAVLAVLPQGTWVSRSTVGFYDHHVAETLLLTILLFAIVYGIRVVQRERPVYEQVEDRDWEGLKPTAKASALVGVTFGLFLLVWPSALVFVGLFGVFLVVAMSLAVSRNESPEHLAFLGAISLLVAFPIMLPWVRTLEATPVIISSLHVLFVPAVALGCVVMAALARYWDREAIDQRAYPGAVLVIGVVGVGLTSVLLPDLFNTIWTNVQRIFFLGQTDTTLTIGEAQSMDLDNIGEAFYVGYGFAAFTALLATIWIGARGVFADRGGAEYLLIAVVTVAVLLMTITQQRFHYYLVVLVAVLNGWLVVQVLRLMEFPSITAPERLETHHVLTVVLILTVLFVPVLIGGVSADVGTPTAADRAAAQQPGAVELWDENTDWMAESTPQPGEFGGEDNAMDYYGPFETPPGEDYEYPPGAYGVMSWWDYGHWITVDGERPPMANPFQEGPRPASAFFQETDEDRANLYLDALSAHDGQGSGIETLDDEELEDLAAQRPEGEGIRYVTIDDQMAGGKFGAITEWAGPDEGQYVERQTQQIGGEEHQILSRSEQYDQTMLSRLYFNDAAGMEQYRLVKEAPAQSVVLSVAQGEAGAYEPILVGVDLQTIQQRYPRLYQAILPQLVNPGAEQGGQFQVYDVRQASAVKTFERVEGATITGSTDANGTVRASVQLETEADRETMYVQQAEPDENGEFELTVPYATDDQLGVEDGYTEPDVTAVEGYTVEVGGFGVTEGGIGFQANERAEDVEVPEPAIYEGEEIEVELEEVEEPENATQDADGLALEPEDGDQMDDGTQATDEEADGSSTAAPATWTASAAGTVAALLSAGS